VVDLRGMCNSEAAMACDVGGESEAEVVNIPTTSVKMQMPKSRTIFAPWSRNMSECMEFFEVKNQRIW